MNAGPDGTPRPPHIGPQPDPAASAESRAAGHGAGTPMDAAHRMAGSTEERLREAAAAGEQRLRETGEEARIAAERAMDHVREYTKENPLAAAGIAFAAGVILSRLFSR
jgi:ElaB/YqjD/DUF883 family membrane-anchored ribosome-binding protein